MDGFLLDVRSAWRAARRRPQLTILTVLTLVLGIGANTAIFAVARGTLLRPLPYSDPDSLVMIWRASVNTPAARGIATPEMVLDYRARASSFADVAAVDLWTSNLTSRLDVAGSDGADRLRGSKVTPNFFTLLGVPAALGRTFAETDEQNVVVLSDALWRRRYGADAAIIGQTIEVAGGRERTRERFEVIGVLPPRFRFTYPDDTELWSPLPWTEVQSATQQALIYHVIARLKDGVGVDAAKSDMAAVVASIQADRPKGGYDRTRVWIEPVHEWSVGRVRPAVRLIVAVTALLLLIACLNVATLLLAQTAPRRRELALQQTLGASRGRLVRQMLTEAGMVTLVSTVAAVSFVMLLQRALRAVLPPLMPRVDEVGVDPWTIGWTTAIAAATLVLAALLPSWRGARVDPYSELVIGGRGSSAGRVTTRLRQALTALQIAAASIMLIAGGLLLGSLWNLQHVDLGFDGDLVLTQELRLLGPAYREPSRRLAFHDAVLQRVREIPGVREAASTTAIPFRGVDFLRSFSTADPAKRVAANARSVDPAYFGVMRIPLVAGRLFTASDNAAGPLVAVVSEAFVREYFADGIAVGRQLPNQRLVATDGKPRLVPSPLEIVGVVGDVRTVRVEDSARAAVYLPQAQDASELICLVMRTDPGADHVAAAVRSIVRDVDPNQPVGPMTTVGDVVAGTIADRRFIAIAATAFAIVALLLTVAGLYGVMVIAATERVRELGIRIALGATRRAVIALLVRQGLAPVLAGALIGSIAASWAMRFMTSYLFEVKGVGASTYAAIVALVMLGGLAACVFPARIASRVDPMQALRSE
jgi:putative ABC transport system permease protein